jgi:hypothetical protein
MFEIESASSGSERITDISVSTQFNLVCDQRVREAFQAAMAHISRTFAGSSNVFTWPKSQIFSCPLPSSNKFCGQTDTGIRITL